MAQARGGIRRAFIRVREAVEDWVVAARSDLYPQRIVYLARFGEPHEFERFQVTTDRVLGGSTDCTFSLKHYAHFSAGVFEGVIDYHDENPQSRGGFASFRTKADEKERLLGAYEALEMRIKTDGRPYIWNVKCADFSPEHLWQMRIVTPPFRWTTVALPFSEMMLTRRGRVEIEQKEINKDCINGFGVLLADGCNGPFRFEIQHLRAMAEFDPTAYSSAPEQILEREQQRRLGARPQEIPASGAAAPQQQQQQPEAGDGNQWLLRPLGREQPHSDCDAQRQRTGAREAPPRGASYAEGEAISRQAHAQPEPAPEPVDPRQVLRQQREAAKLK